MPNFVKFLTGYSNHNWTDTGLISATEDWSQVPSIIAYRGDGLTASTGTNPGSITGDGTRIVNVLANQTNPNTLTSGGIGEFELGNPTVAL